MRWVAGMLRRAFVQRSVRERRRLRRHRAFATLHLGDRALFSRRHMLARSIQRRLEIARSRGRHPAYISFLEEYLAVLVPAPSVTAALAAVVTSAASKAWGWFGAHLRGIGSRLRGLVVAVATALHNIFVRPAPKSKRPM